MIDVVVHRDLRADDGRGHDFLARLRAAGETWTGEDSVDLVELLADAGVDDPELTELVRTGGSLLADFLEGYRRSAARTLSSGDLAKDLIEGRPLRPEQEMTLAPEYVVALVHWADRNRAEARQAEIALRQAVGAEVLSTTVDCGVALLVPGTDARITKQIKQFLGRTGWLATATRPRRELRDGFREAADVLRLVEAGRRPSGAYTVLDVLAEYAVMQDEAVAAELTAIIRPLHDQPMLWETLTALIDADYRRDKAARKLFIHRSTLNYRLQRIAAITGCDPTVGRGVQVLTAAVILDALHAQES